MSLLSHLYLNLQQLLVIDCKCLICERYNIESKFVAHCATSFACPPVNVNAYCVKYICICYDLAALVFASGLATTTAVTYLLKSGDHILSMNDLYGGWTTYSQSNNNQLCWNNGTNERNHLQVLILMLNTCTIQRYVHWFLYISVYFFLLTEYVSVSVILTLISCTKWNVIISLSGTNRFFKQCATRMGIETSFVDCTVIDNIKKNLKPNTKVSTDVTWFTW